MWGREPSRADAEREYDRRAEDVDEFFRMDHYRQTGLYEREVEGRLVRIVRTDADGSGVIYVDQDYQPGFPRTRFAVYVDRPTDVQRFCVLKHHSSTLRDVVVWLVQRNLGKSGRLFVLSDDELISTSPREIAARFGCSRQLIYMERKRRGLKARRRVLAELTDSELMARTCNAIAREASVSQMTVHNERKRRGLKAKRMLETVADEVFTSGPGFEVAALLGCSEATIISERRRRGLKPPKWKRGRGCGCNSREAAREGLAKLTDAELLAPARELSIRFGCSIVYVQRERRLRREARR